MRKALYILAGLDDRDIIWMAATGEVQPIAAGAVLIEAGRPVTQLYFVLEGSLDVLVGDRRVATLGTGDVVGEMSFVEKRAPSASVVGGAAGELLAIPSDRILARIEADPAFGMRFYRALATFLSDRLRATTGGASQELDAGVLENVQQAGERFLRLVQLTQARAVA